MDMHLKYYQQFIGYALEILAILFRICPYNTTDTTPDIYFKYSQYYTGYVPQILLTPHPICT